MQPVRPLGVGMGVGDKGAISKLDGGWHRWTPETKPLWPKYLRHPGNANLLFPRTTPAPHRNAIALNYKDIGRITRAHGYEPTREAAMAAFAKKLATGVAMAKTTTPLTAQERVILFCTATGVSHAAVGITAHAVQSMAIKGFHRPRSRERG